jgi:hypothetical protein
MLYQDEGKTELVNLFAGTEVSPLTSGVTLAAGQGILKRGSVIGIVTAGGKGKLVDSTASDGSQNPKYILPESTDTTGGDVFTACYKTGVFNRHALVFGGSDTADMHEAALRLLNIHMKDEIEEE